MNMTATLEKVDKKAERVSQNVSEKTIYTFIPPPKKDNKEDRDVTDDDIEYIQDIKDRL